MRGDVPTVGRYAIVGRLAMGGMGVVYRARLEGEGGFVRDFALKKLHAHLAEDREAVQMFLDEARIAAVIRHPNVVATVDVGRDDDSFYVVMDLIEGVSAGELSRTGPLPCRVALRVVLDVLDGLSAAHGAVDADGRPLEIVHRDVSPANILVGRDGTTKLTDFGIAKARERLRTTVGVEVKGKLAYMPPEQLEGGDVDRRADLFSVGVVLWELLTGRSLLHGNRGRLRELEAAGDATRPSWFSTPAGGAIDAVIARALATAPEARFPDARAMSAALQGAASAGLASRDEVGELVDRAMSSRSEEVATPRLVLDPKAASGAGWALSRPATADVFDAPAWSVPRPGAELTSRPAPAAAWTGAPAPGAPAMHVPPSRAEGTDVPLALAAGAPARSPRRRAPLVLGALLCSGIAAASAIGLSSGRSPADAHADDEARAAAREPSSEVTSVAASESPATAAAESPAAAAAESPAIAAAESPAAAAEAIAAPAEQSPDASPPASVLAPKRASAPRRPRAAPGKASTAREPADPFGGRH